MVKILSSLYLFFTICALLAAAFVFQTVFNKGAPVYSTAWFAALGLALAANIAACSLRRVRTAPLHFTLLHAGLVVVIAGAFATRFSRFEAGLPLHAGSETDVAYTEGASYKLPFSVKLKDFRIEYYSEPSGLITVEEADAARTFDAREGLLIRLNDGSELKVLRTVKDFGLAAGNKVVEKSPYWHNPAVQLELRSGADRKKLWFFSNFSGMHGQAFPFRVSYSLERAEIRNFFSDVTIKSPSGPATDAVISVNMPHKFGGYTLYQSSYDPADAGYSLLTVTMDRGVWIVYSGFALFLIGVLLWLRK